MSSKAATDLYVEKARVAYASTLAMGSPGEFTDMKLDCDSVSLVDTSFHSKANGYGTASKDEKESREKWSLRDRELVSSYIREAKLVFSLALPTMFTSLSVSAVAPIAMMFCGHLGRDQLDGVSLANSILNVCGISLCFGMTTACDTLFSQAYGGRHKHRVGMYLQRSLFLNLLLCFFCWSVYLNTEALLLLLGQNPKVARIAGEYSICFMPGLMFYVIYQVFIKYLQNQNRVMPPVVIGGIGNAFNAFAHYIAIYVLDYGYRGSAVVQLLTYVVMSSLTILYAIASGLYKETWGGWSWTALEGWGDYYRIGVAGLIMTGVEWWSYEAGLLMSGLLGEVALGATTVAFTLQSLCYVMPNAFGVGSSIRVGQNLGAGNSHGAKLAAHVSQMLAWMLFVVAGAVVLSLKNGIPLLFTNDPAVIQMAAQQIPAVVLILFLNTITSTSAGTLRGCGRQIAGAICNSLGYVVISVPFEIMLMFVVRIGAIGFWFGLSAGIAPVCVAFLVIIYKTDWQKQVLKAQSRAGECFTHSNPADDTTPLLHTSVDVMNKTNSTASPEIHRSSTPLTKAGKFLLITKCVMVSIFALSVFMAGLLVRLHVPLPVRSHLLEGNISMTGTNVTSEYVNGAI